jgi:hypothetical protein
VAICCFATKKIKATSPDWGYYLELLVYLAYCFRIEQKGFRFGSMLINNNISLIGSGWGVLPLKRSLLSLD